jgi:DNA-binding MarR family transcriptional regulator
MTSTTRLANEAWEALFRAQATLARELAAAETWGDLLPREYGVLYALSSAPSGIRITELCEDALLTQPGMSRLVARMEARGLVAREDDPGDARACRIRLTPAGVETQRRAGTLHAQHVARAMTRALDAGQLEVLRELSLALLATAEQGAAAGSRKPERSNA